MTTAFGADDRLEPLYQHHSCDLPWTRPSEGSASQPDTAGTARGIPPSAEVREALMGYTAQYTADLEEAMKSAREEATQDSPPTEAYVQTERGHCIGQGWHLPSVVAFLVIALEQVLPVESTAAPPLPTWHRERWMEPCSMPPSQRDHIFHTAAEMLATFTPPEDIPPEYLRKLDVSGSGTTPTLRARETRNFARCPSRHGPEGPWRSRCARQTGQDRPARFLVEPMAPRSNPAL